MSICVDRNSKEFKKLVLDLDVHPDNLELIIHEFLNDESRSENPTKKEILLKLSPKSPILNRDEIKLYQNKGWNKLSYFYDRLLAEVEISKRDSLLGKGTSIIYRNAKGEFVVKTGIPKRKRGFKIKKVDKDKSKELVKEHYKTALDNPLIRGNYDNTINNLKKEYINKVHFPIQGSKESVLTRVNNIINELKRNAGWAIEDAYPVKLKGKDAYKIHIKFKTFNEVLEDKLKVLDTLDEDTLASEALRLEQESSLDEEYYINPKKVEELKAQVRKKNNSMLSWDIDRAFEFLHSLENNKDLNQFVDTCIRWLKNNTISLPRDADKVLNTFLLARSLGVDTQKFKSPLDLIIWAKKREHDKFIEGSKVEPHKIPQFQFSHSIQTDNGTIEIFDVENDLEGLTAVCQVLADASPKIEGEPCPSPWCVSTFNYHKDTGKATPTDSAIRNWNFYSRGKRLIAFLNGVPLAFNSTSYYAKDEWWDFHDGVNNNHSGYDSILDCDVEATKEIYTHEQLIHAEVVALGDSYYNVSNSGEVISESRSFGVGEGFDRVYLHYSNDSLINSTHVGSNNITVLAYSDTHKIHLFGSILQDEINESNKNLNSITVGRLFLFSISKGVIIKYDRDLGGFTAIVNDINETKKIDFPVEKFDSIVELLNVTADKYESKKTIDKIVEIEKELSSIRTQIRDWTENLVKQQSENEQPVNETIAKTQSEQAIEDAIITNNTINEINNTAINRLQMNGGQTTVEDSGYESEADEIESDDVEYLVEALNRENEQEEPIEANTTLEALRALKEGALEKMYNESIREPFNKDLAKMLHSILKDYHFEIIEGSLDEVFGDDVLGALDILQKVVYLAHENDRNAITDAEEFAHAFIELMGSAYRINRVKFPDTVLYSELRDLVKNTSIYRKTLEEYRDIYTYENGWPDLPKIKKEALGKALAAVIKNRFEIKTNEDRTFIDKLKQWFKDILLFFKGVFDDEAELQSRLNKIADSIIDGSYAKKYLNKVKDAKKYKLVDFAGTVEAQNEKDGGKAMSILSKVHSNGGVITGSLSYRAQGTVYRKAQDSLHDLDFIVTGDKHGLFDEHPDILDYEKQDILEAVKNSKWVNKVSQDIDNLHIMYAYPLTKKIIVNGIVCEDPNLVSRFMSYKGNFNARLEMFTLEERDKIYLVDFFLNESNDIDTYTDEASGITMTDYTESFNSKLKFGRAKDIFDYLRFAPTHRKIKVSRKNLMYQTNNKNNGLTSSINIYAGTGENAHLSNFAVRPFEKNDEFLIENYAPDYNGWDYAILPENDKFLSVEQAFQYAKTIIGLIYLEKDLHSATTAEETDKYNKLREDIINIQKQILNTTSGGQLRQLGKLVPLSKEAISLWDKHKGETLKELIKESFLQNEDAAKQLLSTGDTPLTHNQDRGEYRTLFPKLLMEVRKELREVFPQHDPLAVDAAYGNRDLFSDSSNDKLQITPTRSIDNKAKDKGSISNKFIGFGEEGSSTNAYRVQAGDKANTGDYNSQDTIFVSVPGKRGDAEKRKLYQDKTIKEAIKAIEAGATLITDNIDYINNSDYNEGEKRLYQNLEHKGYRYETIIVGNSKVGKWTKKEELVIVSTKDTAAKAKEIGGIDTLRHPDENGMHFGNPFSHTNYRGVLKVVSSVKEAAILYEKWLRGEAYQEIEPERRQWIVELIRNGSLKGKPLVYYTEKIPDNSYGTDTYNAQTAPNHAHILQKLINDENFAYSLVENANKELLEVLGNDNNAQNEIKDVVKTVKKGISFDEALKGVESIFTKEEIEQIKQGLNGKRLQVLSVSRLTDPAFFSKEVIKFLEENSKKSLSDPTRTNVIEIWSKHDGVPIQDILKACKKYKVAPMVSFSITGLGDTALEKGVLKYQDLIPLIGQLIESGDLNPLTTTIRIDPILVGETNMDDIKKIVQSCKDLGIKKFVTSLVQSYGYLDGTAKDRKVTSGINNALASEGRSYDWDKYYGKDSRGRINFKPKQLYIDEIGKELLELNKDPEIEIETCSFLIKGLKASACLDPLIIERITGISVTRPDGVYDRDTSRPDCMCYGAHSDMFRVNEKKCFSSCAYCYAGHSNDSNFKYYNEDGTLVDRPLTRVNTLASENEQSLEDNNIEELQEEFDKYSENTQEEQEGFQEIITEENQAYMERMQRINQQLNDLNQSSVLSATEVRDVAEQMVFWISDFISRLQSEPEYAVKQFGKQHEGKDFSKMSRTEIANSIGITNIIARCREEFKPRPGAYKNLKTIAKARQIYTNFESILFIANPVFIAVEDFSIVVSKDGESLEINTNINEDADNFNDSNSEYDVKELEGDLQEHWQIETKTRDVLDRMASPVKRMLRQCVLKDKDGNPVYSEFGVKRRIGLRDATNSILKWTQGAITLEDMVNKLSEKAEKHPWLNDIIDKLNDKSGKYTDLQSQFFGDFCKHFQSYYVVIEQKNGEFKSIPVNEEPALSSIYSQIEAQYKAGEHTLFGLSGVNKTSFNELKSTLEDLTAYANVEITEDNIQEVSRLLGYASTLLGHTTTPELVSEDLDTKGFKEMLKALSHMVKSIEENLDNSNYTPFTFKSGGDVVSNLKNFLRPITQSLEDTTVASIYNNGKMYQSYITPSYTTKLFHKFSANAETFEQFIEKEYGTVPFFKNPDNDKWRNEWIKEMVKNPESRSLFKHKVQLNFNKRNYMKDMNDMEYTVSVITEYFAESHKGKGGEVPAWFRVPMLSNKPSSEFIRFISYRGPGYKDTLTSKFCSIFRQELDRIQTVMTRNLDKTDPDYIENFDKNGKKFVFLEFLNDYLPGNKKSDTELGKQIKNFLDGKEFNEASLNTEAKKVIKEAMEAKAETIVNNWEAQGITKAAKKIANAGKSKEDIRENLINFVWNDTFAAMNIMQLTITDPAYYKHAEDLQKRLAQIHAPGVRGLSKPVDYEGKPVTDGKFRTIKLTDFDNVISNVIDNIIEVFDRKIANAPKSERAALEALKESLVGEEGAFRKINVADAQGYSSPTSYRKKAFRFGKWSKESEEIWKKLREGTYTYSDLQTAFQPLKPFVYSQVIKETGASGAVYDKIKVPVQFKNSEYLLIMADAILQGEGTSKPNLLRAIFEVMEESHFDEKTGEYRTDGIDTVQFESTTKSGLSGAVSVNDLVDKEYGEVVAINRIKSAIYKEDGSYSNAVDVIDEEDYCLQQEVPEHFKNHHQVHGSQGRYIIASELENTNPDGTTATYTIIDPKSKDGVRTVTASEFKKEYEATIAENIRESIDTLTKELHLDGLSVKNRNIALSRILQKEILSSPRYGIDLLQACSVDKNGRFRIPLGDPVQSKRVEQLLNSIVKNRVNKQEIAGGPVVQVSNFGTSKQLNIRFKDKVTGGILKSKEEWEKDKTKHASYDEYKKEHQGGIAYFECYAPIYANEIFSKFADKDGNIDIQTIEDIDPELLKMVGYRIPTEDKYSMAPLKIVGFLPREAGDGIMLPYEITTLSGSDFDVDKMYLMIKEIMISSRNTKFNKLENETLEESEGKYIAQHRQKVIDHIVEDLKLRTKLSQKEIADIEEEIEGNYKLREMAENRRHEQALEDIESRFAHIDELNEKALDETSSSSTKKYLDKKSDKIDKDYEKAVKAENKKHENRLLRLQQSKEDAISKKLDKEIRNKVEGKIKEFLEVGRKDKSVYDDPLMRDIRRSYYRYMYHTVYPTSGREYRNNKIVDMTYEVLTHETSADKVLNPGGFDPQKKMGYMVSVYRNSNDYTWEQLEAMSIDKLKDLSNSDKNLAYIDTHIQFYKQNAAAGSLIGIFAVHRTAHAVLESGTEDGSAEYKVDVDKACTLQYPFTILGMEFGGKMPFDMRYDRNGQLIGKSLGSLVASSADAVKDPVLNLMNINGNTANILSTLVRMGMPFEDAALFLSQSAISNVLMEHSKGNVTSHIPLIKVINNRLEQLRKEHNIGKDSKLNVEELTREELIKGLKPEVSPETEYKVLLSLSKLMDVSKALRLSTFATRFNSSTGSPGPLVIDNLITEYTENELNENSCIVNAVGDPVDINKILLNHPILHEFRAAFNLAHTLLKDMPANSRGFRNILESLIGEPVLNTLLREKKLLGYLSDFYQSYLLMQSGAINEEDLSYYISDFPREFKRDNIKEKYKDNLLIQAIKYTVDKNNRLVLSIDTTGLDTQAKGKLSAAWADLYNKQDSELAIKLFKYNFFKGGIGYNPKTFMNLLPLQVKEKIPGYIDTYRVLPATVSEIVFDQFVRNNWNDDKLVPRKKTISFKHLEDGTLLIDKKSEVDSLYGTSYFKVKFGNEDKLYKITERIKGKYGSSIICEEIKPLGSNKDYIEMSSEGNLDPLHIPSESLIVDDATDAGKDSDLSSTATDNFHDEADSAVDKTEALESLLYEILIKEGTRDKAGADAKIAEFKAKPKKEQESLKKPMKRFFENRMKILGIKFNEQLLEDLYNLMC